MDLRQLEALVTIARLGTYAAAAERLHVTPSALSTRIDGLELEVGRPLFERSGRTVSITTWGAELLPHAERMLELAQTMRTSARMRPRFIGNRVQVGTTDSFLRSTLLPIMERFATAHPRVAIDLKVGDSAYVWELLLTGQIDAGFIADPTPVPGIKLVSLMASRLIWVAAPHFKLAATDSLAALAKSRIFTSRIGSMAYSSVDAICANLGVHDAVLCGIASIEAIIRFAVAGLGIGVLTENVAAPLLDTGLLVEVFRDVALPPVRYSACHRIETLSDAGATLVSYAVPPTQRS
ncbi:LysR family transcriptional regulator [Caballeronia sp. 15711]|uniref:LysR family transcriptional regulator n=1 Tax=Caballeronia sp. 15711 TaxID=3391029 RepID=UPI0039E52BAE